MSRSARVRVAVAASLVATSISSGVAALAIGAAPPPIDLPDLEGKVVDLQELRGKVVVVDFWASWCRPCREEMPVLQALHEKHASEGLVIIGVNIDSSAKKMRGFLKGSPVSFRIVHDSRTEVAQRYEPRTMPSSYLVGRDGKLRYVHEGFEKKDAADIEFRIKQLLAESPSD